MGKRVLAAVDDLCDPKKGGIEKMADNHVASELAQIATTLFGRKIVASELESPDFPSAKWLFSWEWYVDEHLREIWDSLSTEGRWVACIGALILWRRENEAAY